MKTLILSPRCTPDSIALYGAALEAGWEVERLLSWRPPSYLCQTDAAIYGEPLFVAVVASELSISLLEPHFGWLADLPRKYLLREVYFTTLDEARKYSSRAFIKPADDKCFPTGVYDSGSDLPIPAVLPDSTPVLISEPVVWDVEFRFFVADRRVATFSPYARRDCDWISEGQWKATELEEKEALELCSQLAADPTIQLPPSMVVDIGRIENRGWAVVEANAAWASGIYGCDPRRVLQCVARACVRSQDIGAEELAWVVPRNDRCSEP
jgi:hypothetical protein